MGISLIDRRRETCEHTTVSSFSIAGLRRDRCVDCGNIALAYERPGSTGVLFAIPRDDSTADDEQVVGVGA